jgi:hypothetical protein
MKAMRPLLCVAALAGCDRGRCGLVSTTRSFRSFWRMSEDSG